MSSKVGILGLHHAQLGLCRLWIRIGAMDKFDCELVHVLFYENEEFIQSLSLSLD